MLARHADSLFWAGRYSERVEHTARVLGITYQATLQGPVSGQADRWRDVLDELAVTGVEADEEAVISQLAAAPDAEWSIAHAVRLVRENFRSAREHIPSELWEHTNRFYLHVTAPEFAADFPIHPYERCEQVKARCQTLAGITRHSMLRSEGYRFMTIGWMLERAWLVTRLLRVRLPQLQAGGFANIAATLRSASALEAYRRAFRSSTDPIDIASFLLQTPRLPRSVLFCIDQVKSGLAEIGDPSGPPSRPQRLVGQLQANLTYTDLRDLDDIGAYLLELEDDIASAGVAMGPAYFRTGDETALHFQHLLPGEPIP